MAIKLLSEDTIQKIAAGEVIENPYSVIKELVENSIDSGATTIKVEIKNAGKKEIMISDNGCGIEENEIELAFTKHATSKLNNFEDIYSILSFGFRGEALASISSISKVDINTRTKNSEFGIHCFIENTKIKRKNKIGMNFGTTIYIRDLFYNVPIRKKFLKSDAYESSIITTLMNSFALSNPNISFKYIKDSKVVELNNIENNLKKTKLFEEKNLNSDYSNSLTISVIASLILFLIYRVIQSSKDKAKEEPEENSTKKDFSAFEVRSELKTRHLTNSISIKINNTSESTDNEELNTPKKRKNSEKKKKLLATLCNIIISFIISIILIKIYSTHNMFDQEVIHRAGNDPIDFIFSVLVTIFIFSIILAYIVATDFIENIYIKYLLGLALILLLFVAPRYDIRIKFFVLYYFFLIIDYIIIASLPKLYDYLTTPKDKQVKQLDPTKLTLLWTIIVFLLGLLSNALK